MFLSDRVRRRWRQSENTAQNLEETRRFFPTNRIRDAVYTRRGLKWGVPAMLLAAPYIAVVKLLSDVIDQAGSEYQTRAVRSVLIDHGLLPPRDELLARFELWLDSALAEIPDPGEQRTVTQYARWRHLRALLRGRGRRPAKAASGRRRQRHRRQRYRTRQWWP